MKNKFKLTVILHASAEEIFNAWLSSDGHSAMTGSAAKVNGKVGGAFTAWDGYIFGTTLEMESPRRIVQAWRTSEFPEGAPDSRVEILLEEIASTARYVREHHLAMTKITLIHSEMPEDQIESYRQGWDDFYFKPMMEYFGK